MRDDCFIYQDPFGHYSIEGFQFSFQSEEGKVIITPDRLLYAPKANHEFNLITMGVKLTCQGRYGETFCGEVGHLIDGPASVLESLAVEIGRLRSGQADSLTFPDKQSSWSGYWGFSCRIVAYGRNNWGMLCRCSTPGWQRGAYLPDTMGELEASTTAFIGVDDESLDKAKSDIDDFLSYLARESRNYES